MRLDKNSRTEVSDASEVPRFVDELVFWEAKRLRVGSKIVPINSDRNAEYNQKLHSTKQRFLKNIFKPVHKRTLVSRM